MDRLKKAILKKSFINITCISKQRDFKLTIKEKYQEL